MLKDCYGLKVSTSNSEVIDLINLFSNELVKLGKGAECIIRNVKQFEGVPILQIYAAVFHLFAQTKLDFDIALSYLESASKNLSSCTDREKSWYGIAETWQKREFLNALIFSEKHCEKWKSDLVAIKACEYLYYCSGQQFQSKRFLKLTNSCLSANEHLAHFLSVHAFAHELNGNYTQAQEYSEKSIEIDQENPWAHHCLSHIYVNKGNCVKGAEVLESYLPIWINSNRMIESHNMWHLALLYLEQLEFEKVLDTYDKAGWSNDESSIGEEVDAVALLWRLDMEELDVSSLWHDLGNTIIKIPSFPLIPFVNVQLFYALKRAGQNEILNRSLEQLTQYIEQVKTPEKHIWNDVGLPLIHGVLAFVDGNYDLSINHLQPIIDTVGCVGGSDAQVDLFRQTYMKSLIYAKRKSQAASYLKEIIGERELTPLETKWREEIGVI